MKLLALLLLFAALPVAGQTDEARVRAAAEGMLARRFAAGAARMEVRVVRAPALTGADSVRVDLVADGDAPRGHAIANVLGPDGAGGWRRLGQATLYVATWDSVAVARETVTRGGSVTAATFAPAWVETTRLAAAPLRWADALQMADGTTARRALSEGDAVRAADLVMPQAVQTGDPVDVHYQRGGLALVLRGQARERGALGDAVRVYCPDVRTTYRVRLTAPGVGEWIETL